MSLSSKISNIAKLTVNRPSWHDYFMSIALLTSTRSPCERLHVGCVIVKDKSILSTGYNGFIAGAKHNSIMLDGHEVGTIHAEQNAIAQCAKNGVNILNATAYITHFPCINCFKVMIASGIKTMYYNEVYDNKNNDIVIRLANENNINLKKIN